MTTRTISRWRASAIHLLISVAVAAAVLTLMLAIWFPGPLFVAGGGNNLLLILVSVDVVIGPLLTLAVYKQGKWGMTFDLVVISLLQVAAFSYGMHIVYLVRPAFIVFVKDQFEIATPNDIDARDYADAKLPQFRHAPMGGPQLVYAQMPTDRKELNALTFKALAGKDVQQFPKYFRPYEEHAQDVLKAAWTLEEMRKKEPESAKIVDAYMKDSGLREADVRYLRLAARKSWVAVLVDAKSGMPKKMLITEKF